MRGLSLSPRMSSPPGPPGDLEDEEGLKHLQQVWGCLCLPSRAAEPFAPCVPALSDRVPGLPSSPASSGGSALPLFLPFQEAEKLVASLQDSSLEEEQFTAAMQTQGLRHSTAATALPLSHGAARKWFYKDPQGEIQGSGGWRLLRSSLLATTPWPPPDPSRRPPSRPVHDAGDG